MNGRRTRSLGWKENEGNYNADLISPARERAKRLVAGVTPARLRAQRLLSEATGIPESTLQRRSTLRSSRSSSGTDVTPARERAKQHLAQMMRQRRRAPISSSILRRPHQFECDGDNKRAQQQRQSNSLKEVISGSLRESPDDNDCEEGSDGGGATLSDGEEVAVSSSFEGGNFSPCAEGQTTSQCLDEDKSSSTDVGQNGGACEPTSKINREQILDTDDSEVLGRHDIYGRLLYANDFKRVYLSSARNIISACPVWHLQRPVDPVRVQSIVDAKREHPHHLLGSISVFDFVNIEQPSLDNPQKRGILDGQHRLHALNVLLKKGGPDVTNGTPATSSHGAFKDVEMIVEVYPVKTEEQLKQLFLELNMAQMVADVDLPDQLASSSRRYINYACNALQKKYVNMFGSARCRAPNVNRDVLRDMIFKSSVVASRR